MSKTLTESMIQKQVAFFSGSIDHASYRLDGVEQSAQIFKKNIVGNTINVYLYFDDGVVGRISEVSLIDTDGDLAAQLADQVFEKKADKGLYVLFKYKVLEEVSVNEI